MVDRKTGQVFSFADDGSDDEFIPANLELVSEDEALSLIKPKLTRDQIDIARKIAYADPINGSDRLFSEAIRMQIMGEDDYEMARARAISRFEEIQQEYPWPAE